MARRPAHRARPATSPRPARLSWAVHRDVARIFADWQQRFSPLGSEAFAFLLVLEAVRVTGPKPDRVHYGELAQALDVSTNTLRRWLRTLELGGGGQPAGKVEGCAAVPRGVRGAACPGDK